MSIGSICGLACEDGCASDRLCRTCRNFSRSVFKGQTHCCDTAPISRSHSPRLPRKPRLQAVVTEETCCSICTCIKMTDSYGPILVRIVAACFLVAGVGCSLALIIRELRKAPEGYEDEQGFHTLGNDAMKYGVPDSMKTRRERSSLNWAVHCALRIKAFLVRGLSFFGKRVPNAASEFLATSRRRAG